MPVITLIDEGKHNPQVTVLDEDKCISVTFWMKKKFLKP